MIALKIASLLFWLLLIPFCIGYLPICLMPQKERTPGKIFLSGYFVVFALFELIGIPVVLLVVYHAFTYLTYFYMAACILLAAAGFFFMLQSRKQKAAGMPADMQTAKEEAVSGKRGTLGGKLAEYSLEEKIGYLLFFLILGFQLYMAFTRASFDGDDAYYGVQGVIAQQKDMLYRFDAYNGNSTILDVRHALALIPIWEAFIGRMSGIHATIIAHSVMPLLLLPLTYLLYFQIGKKLLKDKKDILPMFMILMALFQMFGNVSIYTNETFLLTRTWQGKSVAGNWILPAIFWIFLCLFDSEDSDKKQTKEKEHGYYVLLACINLAAGVSSSLAVLLSALLVAGLAVLFAIKNRKFSILLKSGLTCIPNAVYVLTYLIISR